jgi:DNA polymerase-3 subunit epsilon
VSDYFLGLSFSCIIALFMGVKKQWRFREKGLSNAFLLICIFIVSFIIAVESSNDIPPNPLLGLLGIITIPAYLIVRNKNKVHKEHQDNRVLYSIAKQKNLSSEVPILQEVPEGPEYGIAGYIDVETTGLSAKKDQIIEFAIALICYEKSTCKIIGIVDSYCGLREPTVPISPEASSVNGIYMHDVKGKDLDYKRINELLDKADFFISHNADFDRKFVMALFPSVVEKDWLCSMNGIDWLGKGFYSKSLQYLLSMHGICPSSAHRASGDVESAIKLLACSADNKNSYFSELITKHAREKLSKKNKPGYYNGKHYTEYVGTIKILRREGEDGSAEKLLLKLLDAVESESRAKGFGVAPWYYEQLAIIYRKRKDYLKELEILERFARQKHSPGASPPKLLERLEKVRKLTLKHISSYQPTNTGTEYL